MNFPTIHKKRINICLVKISHEATIVLLLITQALHLHKTRFQDNQQ